MAIKVDLPAPFSPTIAWTSPARAEKLTDLSAITPENVFTTAVIRSAVGSSILSVACRSAAGAPAESALDVTMSACNPKSPGSELKGRGSKPLLPPALKAAPRSSAHFFPNSAFS
jgi:hypothetical protein